MDLKSELTGAPPEATRPSVTYSLLFPPGWKRFSVDDEAEKAFVDSLKKVFQPRGQAKDYMYYRALTHRLFMDMKKRRASSIYLPVKAIDGALLPASIVVLPAPIGGAHQLDDFRNRLTKRHEFEESTMNGLAVWRWEERQSTFPEGDVGVGALTVHHLFEAPKSTGRAPLMLSATLIVPPGEEKSELIGIVSDLFDAIAGTFNWVKTS
ncbi:hypothetical protein [Paramicrobacterium agarici]|uniref:Uncharacterized protein n=1 Tax=Paramicrobacterium agarici TaxID=630514 RepID=A0A2A9DU90_9MICO|nr:hypothetical protein [Microbacterium agarici]PFG30347.1 hypothetical protein ATJ78_1276 [Microbacterium agarici]